MTARAAVVGVGIDVVETAEIREAVEKFQDRYISAVFAEAESAQAARGGRLAVDLASRFAVKEAATKALRLGATTPKWSCIVTCGEPRRWTPVSIEGEESSLTSDRGVDRLEAFRQCSSEWAWAVVLAFGPPGRPPGRPSAVVGREVRRSDRLGGLQSERHLLDVIATLAANLGDGLPTPTWEEHLDFVVAKTRRRSTH